MKLFNRKRTRRPVVLLSDRFSDHLNRKQMQLATWLNRKTQHWNQASKLAALIALCLIFGGFSLWLLIRSI